jgi:superfamily II DNA or RNA helicase
MNKDQIQEHALSVLLKHKRASVNISMGVGKTLIGLKHMAQNYTDSSMFLVVAPKISIFQSWIDDAGKFGLEYLLEHITFTTYISLHKQKHLYDVVYLDECHSLKMSHGKWLAGYSNSIIGLTGTAPRYKTSEKGQLVNMYCPVVYEYKPDDAIGDNILNDYSIEVHFLPLDNLKNIFKTTKKGGSYYTSEVSLYDYWSRKIDDSSESQRQMFRIMRMKAMMSFPTKEAYAKKLFQESTEKTIIFANTKEQADNLCRESYHSGNKNSEQNLEDFKTGKINKLSAVLQLNEGINIPDLKAGIVLHAYGNERKLAQRLGRLLRLNPNDKSKLYILCYQDTIDEIWVKSALSSFDQSKIQWVERKK